MTRIIGRRMAGEDHAVGKFPPEAFRLSARNGARFDPANVDEAFHMFGCHSSGTEKGATCAGYILRGSDGIGWRIGVATGEFVPSMVSDGGVALFESYYEMAVANGVATDDPALDGCRPCMSSAAEGD
jgi:Family of unknown function (DUF6283)